MNETLAYLMPQQPEAAPEIGAVRKQRTRYTQTKRKTAGCKSWVDTRAERLGARRWLRPNDALSP